MRANGHGKPVVAIDVDGTLADYHGWFLRFAEMYFGREMPSPKAINPGMPLHKFMGVSKPAYRDCKLAYRQGGMKRSMPCLEGADWVVSEVRKQAEVWICTTRPYLRLDNIDPDTREWLGRNGIRYDALLFDTAEGAGGSKYRELKRQAGPRIAAVVEDLPEQAGQAIKLNLMPVYLRNQPYNQPAPALGDRAGVWRWDTAQHLKALLDKAIEGWHHVQGK